MARTNRGNIGSSVGSRSVAGRTPNITASQIQILTAQLSGIFAKLRMLLEELRATFPPPPLRPDASEEQIAQWNHMVDALRSKVENLVNQINPQVETFAEAHANLQAALQSDLPAAQTKDKAVRQRQLKQLEQQQQAVTDKIQAAAGKDYGDTVTVSAKAVKRAISIKGGGAIQTMVWFLTVGDQATSQPFSSGTGPPQPAGSGLPPI